MRYSMQICPRRLKPVDFRALQRLAKAMLFHGSANILDGDL